MRRCSARVGVVNARNKRNCINIVKQEYSPKKSMGMGFFLIMSIMKNTELGIRIRIRNCKKK